MSRFLLTLGLLADVFRPLEIERAALESHLSSLRALRARQVSSGEYEAVVAVVKRGGLVEAMPALSSEHRREGAAEAWRLVFPQRQGERVKVYLGSGEDARMRGQVVIDLRTDYEGCKARFERVVEAVDKATNELWRIKGTLEGVNGRKAG